MNKIHLEGPTFQKQNPKTLMFSNTLIEKHYKIPSESIISWMVVGTLLE